MEQDMVNVAPAVNTSKSSDGKGWKIATIIASVVAVCGIGFGVYGIMQGSQKDGQIADLKTEINDKTTEIEELEAEMSNLDNKTEEIVNGVETTTISDAAEQTVSDNDSETAAILLGAVLDKNGDRTVFKVGDCTADGPSVKCPVTVDGKDALISYNSSDSILRLSLPND